MRTRLQCPFHTQRASLEPVPGHPWALARFPIHGWRTRGPTHLEAPQPKNPGEAAAPATPTQTTDTTMKQVYPSTWLRRPGALPPLWRVLSTAPLTQLGRSCRPSTGGSPPTPQGSQAPGASMLPQNGARRTVEPGEAKSSFWENLCRCPLLTGQKPCHHLPLPVN